MQSCSDIKGALLGGKYVEDVLDDILHYIVADPNSIHAFSRARSWLVMEVVVFEEAQ